MKLDSKELYNHRQIVELGKALVLLDTIETIRSNIGDCLMQTSFNNFHLVGNLRKSIATIQAQVQSDIKTLAKTLTNEGAKSNEQ
jgi:hypothetical protein